MKGILIFVFLLVFSILAAQHNEKIYDVLVVDKYGVIRRSVISVCEEYSNMIVAVDTSEIVSPGNYSILGSVGGRVHQKKLVICDSCVKNEINNENDIREMNTKYVPTFQEFVVEAKDGGTAKDPKAAVRNKGDVVFPAGSKYVKDDKDHFPINSEDQARNALARASQYDKVPAWYDGSLSDLVKKVQSAVKCKYSNIETTGKSAKPGKD